MILAAVTFLTDFARIFHGRCRPALSGKVRVRLVVGATGLILWGSSGSAMALTASAPVVRGSEPLVRKLHDARKDGAGQSGAGGGVALAPSACRMLRVSVRMAADAPFGSSVAGETAMRPRRLGNADDVAEYNVDVCENATGTILFDEQHPFVRRMFAQGGRNPAYGREIDYMPMRHGVTVKPAGVGEHIRLTLEPWLGRVSADQTVQTLEPPEVSNLQMSTTIDAVPGQWVEFGGYRKESAIAAEASPRRTLGNSAERVRVWVMVDDIHASD